jgi:hypothetical protein
VLFVVEFVVEFFGVSLNAELLALKCPALLTLNRQKEARLLTNIQSNINLTYGKVV